MSDRFHTYLDPASLTAAGVSGAGRSSACFDECMSSSWSSPFPGVELLFSGFGHVPVLDLRKTLIVSPKNHQMLYFLHKKKKWIHFQLNKQWFNIPWMLLPLALVVTFPCASFLFVTIAPPDWPDEDDFLLATIKTKFLSVFFIKLDYETITFIIYRPLITLIVNSINEKFN